MDLNPWHLSNEELSHISELRFGGGVETWISKVLTKPAANFLARPSKMIRSQMVQWGMDLVDPPPAQRKESQKLVVIFQDLIESLHAGSLVVDDIQDDSLTRRGEMTLHREMGVPLALNVGNWLYFWPLDRLKSFGVSAEVELACYRLCHHTLLKAHYGQALDLGIAIEQVKQSELSKVCLAVLELKTGALMSLALRLGGLAAGATAKQDAFLNEVGNRFGVSLQMYDDLGNLQGNSPSISIEKKYEDLLLERPGWVWAIVADEYDSDRFDSFKKAVRQLPNDEVLIRWFESNDFFKLGRRKTAPYLETALDSLEKYLDKHPNKTNLYSYFEKMAQKLSKVYEN